ncbi:hypothetical protein BC940DRAFT_366939 [Gongronella butleri]|nr:hypothetical protein BC940DRAFT_366939 [Gongronella butleri]
MDDFVSMAFLLFRRQHGILQQQVQEAEEEAAVDDIIEDAYLQARLLALDATIIAIRCSPIYFASAMEESNNVAAHHAILGIHRRLDDSMGQMSYYKNYRMRQRTFMNLVETLSSHPAFQFTAPNATPVDIQIACVLWRFANAHIGYRTFAVNLGYSQGSYRNFTKRFVIAIKDTFADRPFKWPRGEKAHEAAALFQRLPLRLHGRSEHPNARRLPNVIGAIDGKLVTIHRPIRVDSEAFRNRKSNLSLNLLAICDANLKFTALYSEALVNPADRFPDDTYILGDSAYPLMEQLITPFPSQYLYVVDVMEQSEIIYIACQLHNMCIDAGDLWDEEEDVDGDEEPNKK